MSTTTAQSRPLPQAHPDYLRVLASWFGHSAPSAEQARVLDIGCANGSHLIALAIHLPHARLVGIDVDANAIEQAQKTAKAIGLSNVRFICSNVVDLNFKQGVFDYVICHDVFSLVDDDTRSAILRQISHVLSEKGVALVSYAAEPGWQKMRWWQDAIRSQFFNQDAVSVESVIEQITLIQGHLHEQLPWSAALRPVGAALLSGDVNAAVQRLFNPNHRAFKLIEFLAQANQAELVYVGDTDYQTLLRSPFQGDAQQQILERFGSNVIARQQCYDYMYDCALHQTLLIKPQSKPLNDPARGVLKESLLNMHVQGSFQPPFYGSDNWYALHNKNVKITDTPITRTLCTQMNLAGNATVSVEDLLKHLAPDQHAEVLSMLIELISARGLRIRASALNIPADNDIEQPEVLPQILALLRSESYRKRSAYITNPWLQVIELDEAMIWLMRNMTGKHSKAILCEGLAKACREGKFSTATLQAIAGDAHESPDWREIAQRKTNKLIQWLAQQGLLVHQKSA